MPLGTDNITKGPSYICNSYNLYVCATTKECVCMRVKDELLKDK